MICVGLLALSFTSVVAAFGPESACDPQRERCTAHGEALLQTRNKLERLTFPDLDIEPDPGMSESPPAWWKGASEDLVKQSTATMEEVLTPLLNDVATIKGDLEDLEKPKKEQGETGATTSPETDILTQEHHSSKFLPHCHISIVRRACAALKGDRAGCALTVTKPRLAAFLGTSESKLCADEQADDMTCMELCHKAVSDLQTSPGIIVPDASDLVCYMVQGEKHCEDVHPAAVAKETDMYAPQTDDNVEHSYLGEGSLLQRGYRRSNRSSLGSGHGAQGQRSHGVSDNRSALLDVDMTHGDCASIAIQIANLFRIYPTKEVEIPPPFGKHHAIAEAWASIVLTELNSNKAAKFRDRWFGGDGDLSEAQVKTRIVKTFYFLKRELQQGFHYVFPAEDATPEHCGSFMAYVWGYAKSGNEYKETEGPVCSSDDDGFSKQCGIDEDGKYYVYVCNIWSTVDIREQVATIIHEAAHHAGPRDQSYEPQEQMKLSQAKQIDNAASYQNFGRDVVDSAHGCSEPALVDIWPYATTSCSAFYDMCHVDEIKCTCRATCGQCDLPSCYPPKETDDDGAEFDSTINAFEEYEAMAPKCNDWNTFRLLWTLTDCEQTVAALSSVQHDCSRATEVHGFTQADQDDIIGSCTKSCDMCHDGSVGDAPEASEETWMNIEDHLPDDLFDEGSEVIAETTPAPPPSPEATKARYVRIWPTDWQDGICRRKDHSEFGPGACICTRAAVIVNTWRGHEVVDPLESHRKYSSVMPSITEKDLTDGYPGSRLGRSGIISRFYPSGDKVHNFATKWCAKHNRLGEWLEIDLGKDMDVRGVVLQGPHRSGCGRGQARTHSSSFVKAVKVQTATEADGSGNGQWRNEGKEWDTSESEDRGVVRIVFSE